jgi:hypothetical protein
MKKKFLASVLTLGVLVFGSSLTTTEAATWDLSGSASSCKSCGYVVSKGTISVSGTSYKFYGYGSTVWSGGYGGNVTTNVTATTRVGYINGGNSSQPHSDSTTAIGTGKVLASTGYFTDYHNALYSSSATVSVSGSMSSADFKYFLNGYGDPGMP